MGTQFFIVFPEKTVTGVTSDYFEVDSIPDDYIKKISETLRLFTEVCQMDSFTFYYDRTNIENFRRAFVADKYALRILESVAKRALEWNDQALKRANVNVLLYGMLRNLRIIRCVRLLCVRDFKRTR